MKPRTLLLIAFTALLGTAAAVLPALAASPPEVKLEVNENCVYPNWPCWAVPGSRSPASKVTIAAGGEITFADHANTEAGVVWMGSAPTCAGVPRSAMTGWEGKCRFAQPGNYRFESSTLWPEYTSYEVVVESAGTGNVSTTTTTTATPIITTTPSLPSHGAPLQGVSGALKLAGSQRGSTVYGSIGVSQSGSGGRLEVSLFASGASLGGAGRSERERVGLLVLSPFKEGRVSFSVHLSVRGKAALRRHRRLALTVKITLDPPHGAGETVTRGLVMHA